MRFLGIWLFTVSWLLACEPNGADVLEEGEATAQSFDVEAARVARWTLYASPTGSGTACSAARPCALSEAKDQSRAKVAAQAGDGRVVLRGGTYWLDRSLSFNHLDANRSARVTWAAQPGETPVLSGGRRITGWELYDARRRIYRAKVDARAVRQLFVNDERMPRARSENLAPGTFAVDEAQGFISPSAALTAWRSPADVEVVFEKEWRHLRCGVSAVSGAVVRIDPTCWSLNRHYAGSPIPMGSPTWFENAYEYMVVPGHWVHERGWLYYLARPGEDPNREAVVAPALEAILRVEGTQKRRAGHLSFEGLTFAHSTWLRPSSSVGYTSVQGGVLIVPSGAEWPTLATVPGAVNLRRADFVRLARNTFRQLGGSAVLVDDGASDLEVVGNRMEDVSASGVWVAGLLSIAPDHSSGFISRVNITDNFISRVGAEYHDSVGVFVGYARDVRVEHNELQHLPYSAISVGWGFGGADPTPAARNHVRDNVVSHYMQRLGDGGGIYALSEQPESTIQRNVLLGQVGSYAALYLDQGAEFFDVRENVVQSTPAWLLIQTQGVSLTQNNVVELNHTDTQSMWCCFGGVCCDQRNNRIWDNRAMLDPLGVWPAEAQAVIRGAGARKDYAALRPTVHVIEAESFNHKNVPVGSPHYLTAGHHDGSEGNAGGALRSTDVDVYACSFCSNGFAVGQTRTGEWLGYSFWVPEAGDYELEAVVSTDRAGHAIEVYVDDTRRRARLTLPNTRSFYDFQGSGAPIGRLSAGVHKLYLTLTSADASGYGFFLDAVRLKRRAP